LNSINSAKGEYDVRKIKEMEGIHKKDIVVMLRNLLLVAASDGKIEKTEQKWFM
jgi:hypothetical protein